MTRKYGPPQGEQLKVIAETLNRSDGLEISRGLVEGERCEFKFGNQEAISNTEITVWDIAAAYVYPPSALTMLVGSSDANDMSTGTGARTVKIWGLDSNYAEIDETVTMLSATVASTTKSYLRVYRAAVLTAGSGGKNAGIIYVGASTATAGVPDDKYAAINVGENQTLMSLFTIPAGKKGYLARVTAVAGVTTSNIGATIRLKIRKLGEVFQTKEKFNSLRAMVDMERHCLFQIPAKSDIEITAERVGGTDVDVAVSFEVLLVDD